MCGESYESVRRREFNNALAIILGNLRQLDNPSYDWDTKILALKEVSKTIPYLIRYAIYFKNTEKK